MENKGFLHKLSEGIGLLIWHYGINDYREYIPKINPFRIDEEVWERLTTELLNFVAPFFGGEALLAEVAWLDKDGKAVSPEGLPPFLLTAPDNIEDFLCPTAVEIEDPVWGYFAIKTPLYYRLSVRENRQASVAKRGYSGAEIDIRKVFYLVHERKGRSYLYESWYWLGSPREASVDFDTATSLKVLRVPLGDQKIFELIDKLCPKRGSYIASFVVGYWMSLDEDIDETSYMSFSLSPLGSNERLYLKQFLLNVKKNRAGGEDSSLLINKPIAEIYQTLLKEGYIFPPEIGEIGGRIFRRPFSEIVKRLYSGKIVVRCIWEHCGEPTTDPKGELGVYCSDKCKIRMWERLTRGGQFKLPQVFDEVTGKHVSLTRYLERRYLDLTLSDPWGAHKKFWEEEVPKIEKELNIKIKAKRGRPPKKKET